MQCRRLFMHESLASDHDKASAIRRDDTGRQGQRGRATEPRQEGKMVCALAIVSGDRETDNGGKGGGTHAPLT